MAGRSSTATVWCLHGALGESSDWNGLAGRLAEGGHPLRAVDLWRFLACRPLALDGFGRALNHEARAGSGPPRVLLGYSMGGRLALHALLDEPDPPWQAAVIVSAHPGIEATAERAARRAADAGWGARVLRDEWDDVVAAWHDQPVLAGGTRPDRRALESRRAAVARSFIDWSLGAQQPLWGRLAGLRLPVLWVAGEHDAKFLELAVRAVGLLPRGELWLAPAAGHRVPWQAPEPFAARVAEFLERQAR